MRKAVQNMSYKGYELQPIIGGAYVVYRNNQIITTEPNLQLALNAIDNRLYSNPDFKQSGYHHKLERMDKFKKEKIAGKEKPLPMVSSKFSREYEVVNVGSNIAVEVINGNKK